MDDDFSQNLKLLCSHYKSISDVCRKLAINRSQFNRYLNGRHKPSANKLKVICDFFGLEEFEILLPHGHFKEVIGLNNKKNDSNEEEKNISENLELDALNQLGFISHGKFDRYLGYYYEYQMSMSSPDKVLRSLIFLTEMGGKVYYQRIERVTVAATKKAFYDLYKGVAYFLAERIFLMDYSSFTNYEISQTILYPSYRRDIDRLTGLKLGVANSGERSPCCVRVLFEYLGKDIELRKVLKTCDRFDFNKINADSSILHVIKNEISSDDFQFRAKI